VACIDKTGATVADGLCTDAKPIADQICNSQSCSTTTIGNWLLGTWSNCSLSCGTGVQSRTVDCRNSTGVISENQCSQPKPDMQQNCNTQDCPKNLVSKTKTVTVAPDVNQVDILLVIDDSSSMAVDNAKLASRLYGFVTDLSVANLDWQMCVTTTDVNYYSGHPIYWSSLPAGVSSYILKKSTAPNLGVVFQQTISDLGSGYSNDEQGIRASILSMRFNGTSNCFRPQAALAVIVISDEDERSVGGNKTLSAIQYKALGADNLPATFIQTVTSTFNSAGFEKKYTFNSIITKDNTCLTLQNKQESPGFIGAKYIELSNNTKGGVGSICDTDYSSNLKYFKEAIQTSVSQIKLECVPYGSYAVAVPQGYTYTASGDTLTFNPVLAVGTTVNISYQCQM
jgi:hypothetical protein